MSAIAGLLGEPAWRLQLNNRPNTVIHASIPPVGISELSDWQLSKALEPRLYTCGHCGNSISSNTGYRANPSSRSTPCAFIYLCHHCLKPTYFDDMGAQVPGPLFGKDVEGVTAPSVAGLYMEARSCMTVSAHTAAALCARKMLMNVAVSKGAKEGGSFQSYVEFLADKRLIPDEAREWVKRIKDSGNDANHTIDLVEKRDAERLLTYVEMLLILVYEFPARLKEG